MKTLSHLQNEAIERFEKKFYASDYDLAYSDQEQEYTKIKDFLKTELETIVKESFKNTRVEEKEMRCLECADSAECECRNNNFSYRLAISDKHNKECEFLGN